MKAPVVLFVLVVALPAVAEDPFDAAKEYYDAYNRRPPLRFRYYALRGLARTRDPRALEILVKRYAKPRVPKEQERYLIAGLSRFFVKPEHLDALHSWTDRYRKSPDAWLRYYVLRTEVRGGGGESVRARVLDAGAEPFLRAAALEALRSVPGPSLLAFVPKVLDAPAKGLGRSLLVESCAAALLAHKGQRETPAFHAAAEAVIAELDGDAPDRTKLVVARHLARVFDAEAVALRSIYWKQHLAFQKVKKWEGPTREGGPRFFGIEGTGRRVAYLLDLSDSMLEPLTDREIEAARKLDEEEFDWEEIRNRFDLARACLKRSLMRLGRDVSFVVVGFGTKAALLRTTKGFVRATRATVNATVRELDKIAPGRPIEDRPHGTLWGSTNLHGALRLAYRTNREGIVRFHSYVDERTHFEGCDTIFLFSDGKPTHDDFGSDDRFDGGILVKNREGGGERVESHAGSAHYRGPYAVIPNVMLRDVRRLNLFRKAEIHCVAIGEADSDLLRKLAELGLGRYQGLGVVEKEKEKGD